MAGYFDIAWSNAVRDGERFYQPSKPCKNGHTCLRRTRKRECLECRREYVRKNSHRWAVKSLAYIKEWGKRNKDRRSAQKRARLRNFSAERFVQAMAKQHGKCAICLSTFDAKNMPHADHCHTTNRPRGILCKHCNFMLGFARDNTATLGVAIEYLNLHSGQSV